MNAQGLQRSGLSIRDVHLTYSTNRGDLKVLNGLSMDVKPREFVSVLGPSGCGKSTLLRLVSGLIAPSSGVIELDGAVVRTPRPDVGMVFQQATLLPWQTVRGNIMMPLRAMGRDLRSYQARADNLIKLVGLERFASAYPHELSGGMQQRAAVARGIIHDPSLLLMDEPFAALDAMTRENMMVELQRIWMESHKAVLFITHSIPEALFLSDRIVVFSHRPGKVIHVVDVDAERPRSIDMLSTAEFGEKARYLRSLFTHMSEGQVS
ncbi:NitT/TauT family transport system ATP-binding protein [Bradyrhizobium sp. AZCC 2262]|uniref:ABC transporter ATP-binding protein n=1 Tax=Bradyrhizobium sp. AZCC 2262 TaxID=3117022 RepID=UPI002FF2FFF1